MEKKQLQNDYFSLKITTLVATESPSKNKCQKNSIDTVIWFFKPNNVRSWDHLRAQFDSNRSIKKIVKSKHRQVTSEKTLSLQSPAWTRMIEHFL